MVELTTTTNRDVLDFDWKTFSELLLKLFKFSSRLSVVPINADRWEEFIYTCLKHMGKNPKWNVGSHKSGADVWTDKFSISVKSGKFVSGALSISSYRLTTFRTIDEMKRFIDGGKNFDIYLSCAREEEETRRTYRVYLIDANIFRASDLDWQETRGGWQATTDDGIVLKIVKKMSNQLWMTIPSNLCDKILEVSIPKNELGIDSTKPLRE